MTLYEIKESIKNAVDNIEVDEETGEILNMNALDELQEQFEDKAENIALYVKNITAEAEAVRSEEKKLAERRRTMERKTERLKAYLSEAMTATGTNKISTPKTVISFRKSVAVELDDDFAEWAKENATFLLDYKQPTANKTAIRNALKNGSVIEHARLAEKMNLVIG